MTTPLTERKRYELGERITHPKFPGDSFVFAGYAASGSEMWCDVVLAEWGELILSEPEERNFEEFTAFGTAWSQSQEAFAASVDDGEPPKLH